MTVRSPEITSRIAFFTSLKKDVQKATVGSELRLLYEKFGNYCANLNIVHAFGNITLSDSSCDENFRKEFLSNIDMAESVCRSKVEPNTAVSSVVFNNTNQQKQNQSLSVDVTDSLRKTLTVEQYEELMDLINKKADKKSIMAKVKEFGVDVLSGVLAGIISNQIMR